MVCSELRHWGLTPVEFCELAGFRVCQSAVGDDDDDDDVLDLGMAAEAVARTQKNELTLSKHVGAANEYGVANGQVHAVHE